MSQSNLNSGFAGTLLAGRLVGTRIDQRPGKDGQPWIRHFLGIEVPVVNGFPGQTDVQEVQVSEKIMNAAFHTAIEKLTGKDVFVVVYPRVYATKNGNAGMQYNLSNVENNILAQPTAVAKVA
ncbi:hypothetical protein IDAT_01040 [Pseudidiomarina atlantica]|uniref:Uncharacterized protein n=1 Tax=Pseudidiomarina atlantica TaxID=1517416 RepID=A0A094IV73_9GAMM|nr:DNA-binding protein [Pseudidiomarina atlantica]KFZ29719.1 hypothetical protein IDAT_01040 [Pseudidiomarina atlantica]